MAGRFGAVVTAMVTPFRDDHSLDLDAARSLAAHLYEHGSDSLVVAGSTGESPTLTHKEKLELFRAVIDVARGKGKVLCGTGTYDTAETLELSREAQELGADGLLLVTPYYNKPPQRGLLEHFTQVANAVSIPVVAYNIPGRTGTRIEHDTLLRIAEVPNIVGVKDSTGDFQWISRLISEVPPDFEVYSGDDWATFGYVCLGAVGIVSVAAPPRRRADPPDVRPHVRRRHPRGAQDPRGADAAVQRAVHHLQPDPGQDRARDGRAPGRTAAAPARAGDQRGARADPQGPGGCRAPLNPAGPRASSSSAASARSVGTWPASSSTAGS